MVDTKAVREVTEVEWWTRDSVGIGWQAKDEAEARARLVENPSYTLHKRVVTRVIGEWIDVTN